MVDTNIPRYFCFVLIKQYKFPFSEFHAIMKPDHSDALLWSDISLTRDPVSELDFITDFDLMTTFREAFAVGTASQQRMLLTKRGQKSYTSYSLLPLEVSSVSFQIFLPNQFCEVVRRKGIGCAS